MMDYEVFKNVISTRIKEFLPPLYNDFEQHIHVVPKINGSKEALILDMEMSDKRLAAPNIYLDDLYEAFKESGDLDEVLENAAGMIVNFTGTQIMGEGCPDISDYKNDIVKTLVNTAANEFLLEAAPHYSFLDLSVIYRLAVEDSGNSGYATALVTNDLRDELGLSDDQLEQLAEENTRRKLKTKIMSLSEDVKVLSTEEIIYGAVNLLRKDVLRTLADRMNDDLYMMALSMHEIVVIKSGCELFENIVSSLKRDIHEIAQREEFLSDSVYLYRRDSDDISIVSE